MSPRPSTRRFCAGIFLIGLALAGLALPPTGLGWILTDPVRFGALALGVVLGELLPISLPRRSSEEEITLSAAFTMALLLVGGLGPALVAQWIASVAQDVHSGKPNWRVRFNVGQYALSILAAWFVVRAVAPDPHLDLAHPIASGQLPGMLLGAMAFYLVNSGIVGVAVALHQGMSIRAYFRTDFSFGLVAGGIILLDAPIVLAAASYSVAIVPLCLAPIAAMYYSISQSARSEHQARHDALTALPNRTAFRDAAAGAIASHSEHACVLLLDLDRFKEVNDTLGHRCGDMLLVQVAERMRRVVGGEAHLARLGGDEFALVGSGLNRGQAHGLALRVAEELRRPFVIEEMTVEAPASIGIALHPEDGADIETLLQRADVAMYHAKGSGFDVAFYDERYDTHSPAKLALTAELRSAVEGREITVWFQPQLDLRTGAVGAVEALVRWEHPRLGVLTPEDFVDMAERSNLIRPLTERVLEVGLRQVADWRLRGIDTRVAINISAGVLVDKSFAETVLAALGRAEVPATSLRLEVTESALMSDPETARAVLCELGALGVESSIDDFGTGYSSLAYLAELPVCEVKIDRSIVARMGAGASERIIVDSTIDLAHHLGKRSVAAGVEQPEILETLRRLGCDAAQGRAISPPLPGPEMTRWLRQVAVGCDDAAAGAPKDAAASRATARAIG